MSIGDRHPIDPLPDRAWDRIRSAVFAELDGGVEESVRPTRARNAWLMLCVCIGAASIAAIALFALVWRSSEPDGLESTRIVTAEAATEATLGDVALHVEPRTALVAVRSDADGWLVVLEHGAAVFAVPSRNGRPDFVVQGGSVRVEVVGTRFRVERVGASSRVDAYEGVVRVVADGQSTPLEAGQRWPASTEQPASHALEPIAPAPVEERETESRPPAVSTPESLGVRRSSDAVEAERHRREFERAASLEASNPEEATRLYRRLSRADSSWSANALYALARLELVRGNRAAAERELRSYLARYPSGPNVQDARELLRQIRPITQPENGR